MPPDTPGPDVRKSTGTLRVFSAGFLGPSRRAARIRRILTLAGLTPRPGWPREGDAVGVWGRTPIARRGEWVARRAGAPLLRVEDAFLRSVRPGRSGEPALGLIVDGRGMHYDADGPSDLETLLATHPFDDAPLIARAHEGIARLIAADLSKYNTHDPDLDAPAPGYVLVVDQVRGDLAVSRGGGTSAGFRAMLHAAQEENPGARIIIRAHPEARHGHRPGHFGPEDADGVRVTLDNSPVSPWRLLEGAVAVYTHSSQLGFEAILAGHRPRVFGQPFYAGWGLTADEHPHPRRTRRLSRAQLFAGAMLLYPIWYDPCRDRLCRFEDTLAQLEAEVRAFREDRHGHIALGMRLWKRAQLQRFFGRERPLRFAREPARAAARARRTGRALMVWAGKETPEIMAAATGAGVALARVEDGFLRSRGLGAQLVPAWSLVRDDLGIYYDPTRESRLERLIAAPPPPGAEARAQALIDGLIAQRLSKYNTGGAMLPSLPEGRRILVPGQVEDDASIRLGAGSVRRNRDLLARVRDENPEAVILYKPHPDVEAGLRLGEIPAAELDAHADMVLRGIDPATALDAADEVWTITSLLGFEALLRGKPVTCLGTPFYAGWGLTRDLAPAPARRSARPGRAALAHATLIAYPRYLDPRSGLPCPAEVIAERLARPDAQPTRRGPLLRLLARLQGLLAGHARLWR